MKNHWRRFILLTLALGCACIPALADAAQINEKYSEETMRSITGQQIETGDPEKRIGDQYMGFAFPMPEAWLDLSNADYMELMIYDDHVAVDYIPERCKTAVERMKESTDSDEWAELYEGLMNNSLQALCVYRVHPDEPQTQALEAECKKTYGHIEELAENEGNRYFLAYNEEYDDGELTDADRADLARLLAGCTEIKSTLMLFPREIYDGSDLIDESVPALAADLRTFSALDLEGNPFTQDDFAKYDLTMVNIWGTFCGPCLDEMGDLARLRDMLPENVNLITICVDAADDTDAAKRVLESVNAKFATLVRGENLDEQLLDEVTALPTTIFVDKNGALVGREIVGTPSEADIAQMYLQQISQRLKTLK